MSNELSQVLKKIGEEFSGDILEGSRLILEVDIGEKAEQMGFTSLGKKYRYVEAVVPLKERVNGMTVRIDGRTFVDYAQLESGIAVPGYVAKEAGLAYKAYEAHDSLIRHFA